MHMELIHVVNNTHQFIVDERNMQDMAPVFIYSDKPLEKNQYVWKVSGVCYVSKTDSGNYFTHLVNAKTGKLLVYEELMQV